jgi:hypothetical protein
MKKLFTFIAFCLLLTSCNKISAPNLLLPGSQVPKWIQEKIISDEMEIAANPQSGLDISAWIRYEFQDAYYFEYRNGYSSSGPVVYNYKGTKILLNQPPFTSFETGKCCKAFVWKSIHYIDY